MTSTMKPSPAVFANLSVDLGERSYPIVIGRHLLESGEFARYVPGKRVAIVTNTLAATDVPAVHAGYARYRRALLEAGVELHELRADPAARTGTKGVAGSSRVSLHAKVMVVDRRQVFVGSMNIDPRSVRLNSENGLVVASTELAVDLATGLQSAFEEASWRLVLEDGRLRDAVP